ncbi:MAG TPA: ergothioneine biosynthesis protein EgtB [Gemmatimonadetes bacterium]|nr:ergothioneine biosynthesis protein EgtB [Gemmatimonadota bacterium]
MDLHIGRRLTSAEISSLLSEARSRTLLLMSALSDEDLRLQHDKLMSPIVWDLGHIGHFEEVWLVENLANGSTGSEGLRGIYNPFENPRAQRDELPLPSRSECHRYLEAVRGRVLERLASTDLGADDPMLCDSFVYRMVLQHEYQHNETMLQTVQLKHGEAYAAPGRIEPPVVDDEAPAPGNMVRFPGGVVVHGTDDRSVAYDNERPGHEVTLAPFWIDVHPATNGEYLDFLEDDGYERRELWSDLGWAWKDEANLIAPAYWLRQGDGWHERRMDRTASLQSERPVCHICYWEAEAYAAWAGKRLPTEPEWEAAASWDPKTGAKRLYPWGDEPPSGTRANLDVMLFQATVVGTFGQGVSPIGCWGMMGDVWEWTSTDFRAYPGYETFPYPEYSEVFFGNEYKVLRGGAWATRFGAIRNTFRNWDYPIRRQIFSGVRCARDD